MGREKKQTDIKADSKPRADSLTGRQLGSRLVGTWQTHTVGLLAGRHKPTLITEIVINKIEN